MSAFDTQYVKPPSPVEQLRSNPFFRTNAPWNLNRISTRQKLANQNPKDLNFQYNFDGTKLGNGVDIYVIDTGSFSLLRFIQVS